MYFIDLYNISITSFAFLKYEIQALKALCQSMNDSIEKLMNNSSTHIIEHDGLDVESLFPIKNDEDMLTLNSKILDTDLRKLLVIYLLFISMIFLRKAVDGIYFVMYRLVKLHYLLEKKTSKIVLGGLWHVCLMMLF